MNRRFQFSLGRFLVACVIFCVALAIFQYGVHLHNESLFDPLFVVGAAGILAAASLGVVTKKMPWLVIGAAIGQAALFGLYWMWGMFEPIEFDSVPMPPTIIESEPQAMPPMQPLPPAERHEDAKLEI